MSTSPRPQTLTLDLAGAPGGPARAEVAGKRLADRLLGEGILLPVQHEHALEYARWRNVRAEEAILALRFMTEHRLLEYVATLHRTRYVSTEQLSRASIPRRLLTLLPQRAADMTATFPVLFDDRSGALTVVTADPGDEEARRDVKIAAGARAVHMLAARPAAVRAAIDHHHRGERWAFRALSRASGVMEAIRR
jgi:hypothetical protein